MFYKYFAIAWWTYVHDVAVVQNDAADGVVAVAADDAL